MKKIFLSLVCFFTLAVGGVLLAKEVKIDTGKTISYIDAKSRWGEEKFSLEQFRARSPNERIKMAINLLAQKDKYVGKTSTEIVNTFGRSDGFFFPDTFPAYIVYKNYEKEEAWQIVFILNYRAIVKDVILQKN